MGMFGSRGGLGSVVPVKAEGASKEAICLAEKALADTSTKQVFIDLRRNAPKQEVVREQSR